jgi:hypothetical protein
MREQLQEVHQEAEGRLLWRVGRSKGKVQPQGEEGGTLEEGLNWQMSPQHCNDGQRSLESSMIQLLLVTPVVTCQRIN